MTSLELATGLLRGGLKVRDAGDILVWMAEHYKYNWSVALLQVEDIVSTMDDEEICVPQPWLTELIFLRKRVKELSG